MSIVWVYVSLKKDVKAFVLFPHAVWTDLCVVYCNFLLFFLMLEQVSLLLLTPLWLLRARNVWG